MTTRKEEELSEERERLDLLTSARELELQTIVKTRKDIECEKLKCEKIHSDVLEEREKIILKFEEDAEQIRDEFNNEKNLIKELSENVFIERNNLKTDIEIFNNAKELCLKKIELLEMDKKENKQIIINLNEEIETNKRDFETNKRDFEYYTQKINYICSVSFGVVVSVYILFANKS